MSALLDNLDTLLKQGTTTSIALELFNSLDPVDLQFMIGRWQGSELPTNHPMDGLLKAARWYGKEFVDPDQVHPLIFESADQTLFKVAPNPFMMSFGLQFPQLKEEGFQPVLQLMTQMLKTEESQARLRMMDYNGKVSATMIYDHLPIYDVFRKVNDNAVLGLMDFKGVQQPFFFILNRSPRV